VSPTDDSAQVERFRDQIARRIGIALDDSKLGMLAELLRDRVLATGRAAASYVDMVEHAPADAPELAAIARPMTVGETYFFRNVEQFRVLREVVFPACMRARASTQRLRLLSAACASGEEPYSIAIAALEEIHEPGWQVSVTGIDINPDVLAKAVSARFSNWSLRETPQTLRRWFHTEGRELVLDPRARALVSFERVNLLDDAASVWQPDAYDAIFCRNVLMYFAPEHARAVIARLRRSLAPHGFLFLGHAEPMRGLSSGFHLRHTHDTFYYQRRTDDGHDEPEVLRWSPLERTAHGPSAHEPAVPAPAATDTTWVEAIRETARRVASITEDARAPQPPESARIDLAPALERLQQERYGEGLALVGEALRSSAGDRGALLLQAVLLVHGGQLEEAERSCRRLLESDDLDAGAHHVLALCREGAADGSGAADHDRVAIYLDPTFAMAHFHLGMLSRRRGELTVARRELAQAEILLEREDAARLLLFGGGFDRRALLALCAAELRACGGAA
jgi:chemotaxis protein methyltransferase CheR